MGAQLAGLARCGPRAAIPALIRSVRDPFGLACDTAAMARSVYRTAAPSAGAMSPLLRGRSMTRHLAMLRLSLDALKKAARTADGTVNDAYLAVVTGGLRRYHEWHGTTVEYLRAVIPISLRSAQDTGWGNKITNIDTAAVPDPHVLLACLQESAAEITALGRVGPARKPAGDRAGHATQRPDHPSARPRETVPQAGS